MISFDANAGAQLRPEACEVLVKLIDQKGKLRNPSSVHELGRNARKLLDQARDELLFLLAGNSQKKLDARLFFTSGGTEACNAIVQGFVGRGGHIVCATIEHSAVLESVKRLQQSNWEISWVDPKPNGVVTVEDVVSMVRRDTDLVILMLANNETGAVQPVLELARNLRKNRFAGAIVSDMTQALGKLSISAFDLFEAGVNAVSISGHKIGAPSGIGAVVIAKETAGLCFKFDPLIVGGPQEERYRAGTENLIGAVAFGAVTKVLRSNYKKEIGRVADLREKLWRKISTEISAIRRLTPLPVEGMETCLSNTLLLQVSGCRGDDLVVAMDLKGVAISTGAACASGKQELSHVVQVMGLSREEAREVVRFSLDWDVNEKAVEEVSELFKEVVDGMREATIVF